MKVLIFTHAFAPAVGGVETYLRLLAEGLTALPAHDDGLVEVTLATRTPRGEYDDERQPYAIAREPDVPALWSLVRKADVVHLGGPTLGPLTLGLLARKPVVVEHHAYQSICPNGLLLHEPDKTACRGEFLARRYDECFRCEAAHLGHAAAAQKVLLSFPRRWMLHGVAANVGVSSHVTGRIALPHSRTIYHGIDDPLHGAPPNVLPLHAPRPEEHAPPVFAYVGRLVSEKGLPLLLDAAATLAREGRAFRLQFIGDGQERMRLEQHARNTGLADIVQFTGFLQGTALEVAVEKLTAVVMPSVWEETAGLAAIEQMMRGRVVVASQTGGLADIVGDAGLRFPVGDADALASCLRRLITEPALVATLGHRARARALQRFQKARMAEEHRALYREVIAARRPG